MTQEIEHYIKENCLEPMSTIYFILEEEWVTIVGSIYEVCGHYDDLNYALKKLYWAAKKNYKSNTNKYRRPIFELYSYVNGNIKEMYFCNPSDSPMIYKTASREVYSISKINESHSQYVKWPWQSDEEFADIQKDINPHKKVKQHVGMIFDELVEKLKDSLRDLHYDDNAINQIENEFRQKVDLPAADDFILFG